ncbi:transposable element Tcb1 transposase [Trichonephila clavipes]|nr:transposable element Tcb1 transposase [Trichonephila clavipes]
MVSDGTEFAVGDIEKLFEARQNTKTKHEKWEKYYNRRRRDVQIKVNDRVLVETHPLSSATRKVVAKFKPKFESPYRVLGVKNNNVVIWKAGKRLTINVDKVRIYRHRKCDETEIGTGSSRITVVCAMNRVVLTEYNGDQMSREMRGRHNKGDQFDPEKAEKGTIVHTSKNEKDQATRMLDEEVINNGKTRKGEERVQRNPCHWRPWKDLIDELKISGMSSRHHIHDFMRGRIIGKIEEGRKITDVAREFDIAHSVVSRLWKSFKTSGMCSRRHGGGRVRRKQISRKTVARRLRGGGLYARRPVVCVPFTRQQRTDRLQWCREHHNWTEQDWACVLFSDESRFSLSSDCRRQLIWRESGTAYRPENIQEKDRYPTCSIMVWAGIMINGRTRLHVVANGTMTGQRHIDEVLLPHDCLDSEGIQRLVWPARSPDLSPIENVWDAFGRQVAGRNYPLTNKNTLIRALTEEWDKLPQQLLDNVVQSMVRRVECCITLHGVYIPY